MDMKKIALTLLAALLLSALCCFAVGEGDDWTCPVCGAAASGNFCSECGERRPEDGTWTCPECGAECTGNFCSYCGAKRPSVPGSPGDDEPGAEGLVRLDLDIAFEKNAYFSTYDVKLYVDDEWIATLRHGIDYAGTVYVAPGKHAITFQQDGGSSSPSTGSAVVNISGPTAYRCEIHAKSNSIQITGEKTEPISGGAKAPDEPAVVWVDGSTSLAVSVEFRKNGMFSQYDVDMYLDDVKVATLQHGKNYEGTLLVSKGSHTVMFCRSGDKSVRGSCSIRVEKDSSFTCRIEAERNRVYVRTWDLRQDP